MFTIVLKKLSVDVGNWMQYMYMFHFQQDAERYKCILSSFFFFFYNYIMWIKNIGHLCSQHAQKELLKTLYT